MKANQSGNVLFYILIAVALLAALSFATTQGTRGSGGQISKEQARLHAVEMIGYGNMLAQAVSQLRLRGYSDTEISFENGIVSGYTNPNCTDDDCKVFHPDGGGINFTSPDEGMMDSRFSALLGYGYNQFVGRACTDNTSCQSDGIDNEDLIFFVPYINREICLQINDILGVNNPSDDAPTDVGCSGSGSGYKFAGSYVATLSVKDSAGDLNKSVGCFKHGVGCIPSPDSYHYYQVLISR